MLRRWRDMPPGAVLVGRARRCRRRRSPACEACWLHGFYVRPRVVGPGVAGRAATTPRWRRCPTVPELELWVLEENHARAPVLREARLARERRDARRSPFPPQPARRRLLRTCARSREAPPPRPALELLAATLPELRRGLTESAARTVAYELFEKLGFGAVAVTDRHAGARVRRRRRRPPRRRRPADPPRLRGARAGRARCSRRSASASSAATRRARSARRRSCRCGCTTARPARSSPTRPPARRSTRPRSRRSSRLGDQLSAQLQLSELAHGDDDRAAGADGAALRLQRAQHDRVVHPHRAGSRAPARARVRRSPAQPARAAGRVRHARRGAAARAELPRARAGALRRRSSR